MYSHRKDTVLQVGLNAAGPWELLSTLRNSQLGQKALDINFSLFYFFCTKEGNLSCFIPLHVGQTGAYVIDCKYVTFIIHTTIYIKWMAFEMDTSSVSSHLIYVS